MHSVYVPIPFRLDITHTLFVVDRCVQGFDQVNLDTVTIPMTAILGRSVETAVVNKHLARRP